MRILNNCEKCFASFEPYKTGRLEDCGSYWCELSTGKWVKDWRWLWLRKRWVIDKPKGVCQFCNPKSNLYIKI